MYNKRKELYVKLIKESFSFKEVCEKANISITTGNYDTLKKIVEEEGIDISHFKRRSGHLSEKISLEDILTGKKKCGSSKLRKRLLDAGLKEHRCECCGRTTWNDIPIPLQVHHIDGNHNNNSIDNLQMLCPNCHSLTENWCSKNQKKVKRFCQVCGKEIFSSKARFCSEDCKIKACFNKAIGKINKEFLIKCLNESETFKELCEKCDRQDSTVRRLLKKYGLKWEKKKTLDKNSIKEMITFLLNCKNFSETGRKFGLSDNGVRKRLKKYGYPTNIKELETIWWVTQVGEGACLLNR